MGETFASRNRGKYQMIQQEEGQAYFSSKNKGLQAMLHIFLSENPKS
ncbi:hypothetical protein [Alcaligenes sp. WGS1538]